MPCSSLYTPFQRFLATLLLFSLLLGSCCNPNIGMGKKALPTPEDPAKKQSQYEEKAYDSEQKQLLHICPDAENTDQLGYVYVGRAPSQAKPHPQLLTSPAARQVAPPSQVGLAQPQQVETNTQQAQEQPGRQAVLALTNPRQQTGSERQLPPPARATSKPLATPSSESFSQQFDQNKSTSAQHTPRRGIHSLKKQNKLQHSQQAAQAKRQPAAAVSELAQPAQPSPAITPLLPTVTQPKSLADKAPQDIASQVFLAQGGQHVRFMHHDGQWQASVREPIGMFSRVMKLPVVCERHGDVEAALFALQGKPDKYVQRRIHVLPAAPPYLAMVYIGEQGLKGGGGEPSGSDDPLSEAPAGGKEQAKHGPFKAVPHSISGHDVPRALELTESKGPTELELAQIEAKRLQEEIAEQYSNLPQATMEEADLQVLDELIPRLEALLKQEVLCAPAQGDDGAKEYIARLREEHRSRWGQTAYGAAVNKQLTGLLEQAYGQELKRVAPARLVDKTPEGVARIAQVLGQLATLYQEQGEETGELSYYTDAAVFYQNLLSVCEGEKLEGKGEEAQGYQEQIEAAYSGLAKIREAMLARIKGGKEGVVAQEGMRIAELQEEIPRDKQALQALRADAKTRVAKLEAFLNKQGSPEEEIAGEKEYIEGSRALFGDIAKGVREFLGRLYQESEQALGPAPCKYTVMGLGSMALEQMTPYSDLEFAILMEEAKDKATAKEYREYLRQLTHLVHFRVINLGETVIPESKYENKSKHKISLDHLTKRGINFDLGGKTPLGRKDKPYDLIQPVAGMMRYLKNEGNKIEHMDKLLPFILESTCYVHGDKELHEEYVDKKSVFLLEGQTSAGIPEYKARALKKLLEGVVEMDYSKPGITRANPKPGDLADFEPQFDLEDAGRLYDVKQEIYRLPDRLLYRLAMYYGILPESGWDAVEQLASRGIIGQGSGAKEASHHLQYTVSFATMLRLRTYLHHDQQAEHVTMLSGVSPEQAQQAVSKAFLLPKEALQAGGSLFKYYYTALPLHSKMEAFCEAREGKISPSKEAGFFQEESFYDASDDTRGDIYLRLLQYKKAIACYELILAIEEQDYGPEHPNVAMILNNLGSAWYQLDDSKQAISYFKRALAINEKAYDPEHPYVAASLNNLGTAWNQLRNPKEAIECFKRALAIIKKAYDPEHPHVAASLNNLGRAWDQLMNPKEAIECFKRALAIIEKAYDPEHPHVAASLNSLGLAWDQLGDPKEAISYYERALAIYKNVYGPEHPHVATSLNNLGSVCYQLGDWKQAISYSERALAIYKNVYGPEHPSVATNLNHLGLSWNALGDPKKAIGYLEQALAINQKAYGPEHPSVATNLNHLGLACNALGDPKKAIGYLDQALAINQKAYDPEHPRVATNLNNLGEVCRQLGGWEQAKACYERALSINEKAYGSEHPEVATNLNNLGTAWNQLGGSKQAIGCFKRALAINEKVYGPEHPEVAANLNNLGSACYQLGDSKEAISYFERALPINEKVYGPEHPEVATNLNNLGSACYQLGDSKEAISYFERALPINEKVYGPEHPEVATNLNNLGSACYQLGDSKEAISYFERDFHIIKKVYGKDHSSTQAIKRKIEQLAGRLENNVAHQTNQFVQACGEGKESVVTSMRVDLFEKDLYDEQGNALIAWMAQHEMMATLEQVLKLGWNPNLPNTSQVYPLHYGAMKNPGMVRVLLPYADPFVQNDKGHTPAMVAKNKGNMEALSLLVPSITGLSLQDPAAFDNSYATCKAHFLATPTHSFEHLVQVFTLACHFKDWELAREVATRHNLRPILSQVTQQYPAAEKSLFARIDSFTKACKEGQESLKLGGQYTFSYKIAEQFTFEKDLYDAQGNSLISWMAQHEMTATLEQVLNLGWNPNLPDTSQVYPLHYAAMKNPGLTSRLLQAGAHPFVQTAEGNTPAQVARSKGNVATLAVMLPSVEGISFKDMAAFEESYQTYKQDFSMRHQDTEELLAALELALQLGDTDLTLAIQAKQASENLLGQLIGKYPLAKDAIQARYESMLKK